MDLIPKHLLDRAVRARRRSMGEPDEAHNRNHRR